MNNIFDNGFYENKTLTKIGFKKIGKNVKISKSCLIIGIKNISLGSNIRIDAFTSIIADKGYDSDAIREYIRALGRIPVIPFRKNRKKMDFLGSVNTISI